MGVEATRDGDRVRAVGPDPVLPDECAQATEVARVARHDPEQEQVILILREGFVEFQEFRVTRRLSITKLWIGKQLSTRKSAIVLPT